MKEVQKRPPRIFLNFLRWFCRPDLLKYIEGDLIELHAERVQKHGARRADARFVTDVLLLFRPGIIRKFGKRNTPDQIDMFRNYFTVGLRMLLRTKGYSAINVGGLAIGMAVAMLIGLWVYDELSFNKYHGNYDSIVQLWR